MAALIRWRDSAGLSLQNAVHSQQVLNQISSVVISKAVTMRSVGWRQGRVSCIGRCAGARRPGHAHWAWPPAGAPVRMAGRPFVRPTLSPADPALASDFFMKFLMNALKKLFGGKQRADADDQAAVAVAWASRRRHKPCPRALGPADCPIAKPAGPACPVRPGRGPGGDASAAPAPGLQAVGRRDAGAEPPPVSAVSRRAPRLWR